MSLSRSRLSRLFSYSKDTAFDAQENFTTEALAMAIEDDRRPMVDALFSVDPYEATRVGLRSSTSENSESITVRPSTQVSLPQTGRIDLVLDVLRLRGGLIGSVWVEVKIGAPESGTQLDAYARRAQDSLQPIWLITLAHAPLRPSVRNLTWHRLYRCARHRRQRHESWDDLLRFLEDQDVANDALGPISDVEAASLEPAFHLAQKVTAIVRAVYKSLPDLFGDTVGPKLRWKAEGELLNYVGANFRGSGELWGSSHALRYGLTSEDGTAYWTVAVRGEWRSKSAVDAARTKAATEAALDAEWERPSSGPTILQTRIRATTLSSHEQAVEWFIARLRTLAASHVLDVLIRGDEKKVKGQAAIDPGAS